MPSDPTYLLVPLPLPSALELPPQKPILKEKPKLSKQRTKTKIKLKTIKKKNLVMEAVVWPGESHSLPFSPYIFTCKCSLL